MQEQLLHPKYRADIDGLRAFAVLSVVLFHAFPGKIKGGFVGVDVFFVISGYLISTIIFQNLEKGTFRFTEFYARRVKRIFPALLLVLLSCLAFGWFALLGDEYKQLGKHILAGTGFVSNFAFWNESGYFDNVADSKPLLHLWSLGIEEQFYIFWPLLVWFCWKRKLGLVLITLLVLLTSFYLNIYGVSKDAVATFYSPLTRFWELLIGSLLAYSTLHKYTNQGKFSSFQSNFLSILGAAFLFSAVFLTEKKLTFPGWWALLPVIGATLVIMGGTKAWVNRVVLSNKIVVWFGLISFPLYLWHWPILSFGRIVQGEATGSLFRASAVLVSVLLAWLTYRFVEKYIRFSKGFQFINVLIISSLAIAAAGTYVYVKDGLNDRNAVLKSGFNEEVRKQFMGSLWKYTKNDICLSQYPYKDSEKLGWWFCIKSSISEPSLIILGNSYANQLYPGFVHNPLLNHHTILSIGTCDFADKENFEIDGKNPCYGKRSTEQIKFIDDLVSVHKSIKFAVLDGLVRTPEKDYIERLRNRIDFLESKGIQVIVFTPHLKPNINPKACFTTPLRSVAKDCTFPVSERKILLENFKPLIISITKSNPNVRFFEQNQIFCKEKSCSFILNGMPLNRDEAGHLSEYGSIELQTYFTEWAKENVPELFRKDLVQH